MNTHGSFIARLINTSPRAFASGAIDRSEQLRSMTSNGSGYLDALGQTELRLRHLAEALAVGRRLIFVDDVAWAKTVLAARNLDIDILEQSLRGMSKELGERLPASHASMAVDYIEETLEELPGLPTETIGWIETETARRFAESLVNRDEANLQKIADEHLAAGGSAAGFCDEVIAPAQREVGRLWQIGQLSAGTEHIGSRFVESLIGRLRSTTPSPDSPRVLIGCGAGEPHDIGARMAALAFSESGWDTTFFGASLPSDDLARIIELRDPGVLVLSVQLSLHLTSTARQISELREANVTAPILVGGAPLQRISDLWQVLGANGEAGSITTVEQTAAALLP